MDNNYLNNKVILKYCPDYYRIINEEFSELDTMSDKVIEIYQSFIFSIDINEKEDLKLITQLNKAVCRYFDDREFKKMLTLSLMALRLPKSTKDVLGALANEIIKQYNKYMEGFTRNLYIPKWI